MTHPEDFGRIVLEWWLVLILAIIALAVAVASEATSRVDFLLYDVLQRNLAPSTNEQLLLVAIDDRSIAEEGSWPWPRDRTAKLVDTIGEARPAALGLDMLLLDTGAPASDAALSQAIGRAAPTFLPVRFAVPGSNGAAFDLVQPAAPLRRGAAGLGQVAIVPDSDGLIRRAYLHYRAGGQVWPSLAALVAGKPERADAVAASAMGPIVGTDPVLISFAGPSGTFPTVSAVSVMRGEVPPEFLRGRRILVGVTASGVGDVYATSAGVDGSLMPGVEIQANLVATLLDGRPIAPADGWQIFVFALLPLVLMLTGLRFLRPRLTLPLIVALACAVMLASFGLFHFGALWLPPATALTAILLAYPVWSWRKLALASHYFTQELERSSSGPAIFPERGDSGHLPIDALDRQMYLLSRALQRERSMRRFVTDRLAQMPDYVQVTDLEGRVVFANAGTRRLFADLNGGGTAEMADDLLAYFRRTSPSGRSPIRFAAATRTQGVPWHCEAETWTGGCFEVRFEPQRDGDDRLVGHVIRIIDKTDATVAQRQRDEALQLLSHDMRAPQASIISFLDSLPIGAVEQGIGERIRGYARHTLKLADDFVHFAKAQTLELHFEELDIADLAHEAADSMWPQARAKGVQIVLNTPPDGLSVVGSASLLSRMLINLIDNAIKFSPPGETVDVICSDSERGAIVTLHNGGAGIAPERMALLYQRFQSMVPAGGEGVGLGLAFVQIVVRRHGGTIQCASADGEGTTFTVELPGAIKTGGA